MSDHPNRAAEMSGSEEYSSGSGEAANGNEQSPAVVDADVETERVSTESSWTDEVDCSTWQ